MVSFLIFNFFVSLQNLIYVLSMSHITICGQIFNANKKMLFKTLTRKKPSLWLKFAYCKVKSYSANVTRYRANTVCARRLDVGHIRLNKKGCVLWRCSSAWEYIWKLRPLSQWCFSHTILIYYDKKI